MRLDASGVAETFGVPPQRVRDVLGLMGDSVDNIPGVPGVGEKTALAVVSTYGDIEAVIERAGRFVRLYDTRDALLGAIEAFAQSGSTDPSVPAAAAAAIDEFRSALDALLELEADSRERDRLRAVTEHAERTASAGQHARSLKRELKGMDRGSSKRIWYAIHEHADRARLSRELATLHYDVPVAHSIDDLRRREPDREAAATLFRRFGFRSLTREFASEGSEVDAPVAPRSARATDPAAADTAARGRYTSIFDRAALEGAVAAARAVGRLAVDTETDSVDPLRARLVGISLAWTAGQAVYIPVGHDYDGAPPQLALDEVRARLGPLLADRSVEKVAQNLIYDDHVLRRHGMPVSGWVLDTMVAAFLLNSSRSSYSMDSLAAEHLGYTTIRYEEVAGKGAAQLPLSAVAIDRVTEYAAEDADVTLRLAVQLEPLLASSGVRELYDRIDGPLLPLLARMEAAGIRVDVSLLERMSGEMEGALATARDAIHREAGLEFNVDSPKQLREVLFERLGLKPRRKTAKSKVASTDAQTLEELAADHEIARRLLEYRELAKLKGTYVDALPRLVHPETGRVHTSYHPTGAATGRLSSSDPNLQNIPARTEAGRAIRSAFIPDPGYLFLASDYSQVELRVLAHLAEDAELTEAFRRGEDIHRYTAAKVFGVAPLFVTPTMRRRAKAVNFGILYGMSETRLAREQGMERGEAREFIRAYFERFGAVRGYIDAVRERALRDAAVRTLFGRVRWFPQLHRRVNRALQEQALRAAVNTTIQGTAADLMKLAMLAVARVLDERRLNARMLLQVHDELLLEVPLDELDATSGAVREAMEGVGELAVPLVVDQKSGANWLEVT